MWVVLLGMVGLVAPASAQTYIANNFRYQPPAPQGVVKPSSFRVAFKGGLKTRYRYQKSKEGETKKNHLQGRTGLDLSMYFLGDKIRIDLGASTGNSYGGSYDNWAGKGKEKLHFNLRRLAMTYSPTKGLELTAGSMGPEYGVGTQATQLDKDGYIAGYRAKISFAQTGIVVTGGFLGDFDEPNVFKRTGRMDEFNYLQTVITQAIGRLIVASMDYNYADGDHLLRAAFRLKTSQWVSFMDALSVEGIADLEKADQSRVIGMTLSKQFKDLLAGRDLKVNVGYFYADLEELALPIDGHTLDGHQVRVKLIIPNLIQTRHTKLGFFIDHIHNLSDLDEFRIEIGFSLGF